MKFRISGLDPANPPFFPAILLDHLSHADAEMVDIIHTGLILLYLQSIMSMPDLINAHYKIVTQTLAYMDNRFQRARLIFGQTME